MEHQDNIAFRHACEKDINRIMLVIQDAKNQMAREGKHQWTDGYPAVEDIQNDISANKGYVMTQDGVVIAYGCITFDGEPAYEELEGKWLSHEPYIVLHRLAVSDEVKGRGIAKQFFREAEQLAVSKGYRSFKIDTNYDNDRMLHIMQKMGFTYCGIVHYQKGDRLGFEKLLADS
ncbi:MAG: GNAT family N-acetyltransferase [Prevotella sp.]|jgi:GNAT superfamily N-acetyltransferase